jgi:PadR family transcriptional regulator, regulatory protein PadR
MVIFRAASSLDICCGAYRATGAEYGWMPADGAGLYGQGTGKSLLARCFWVDILPGRGSIRVTCLPETRKSDWNCCRAGWVSPRVLQQTSDEELLVEHGALYPALQRLEERGWISAKWGTSTNNRKARFYTLTSAGRKQLVKETGKWNRLTAAIGRILESEEG